MQEKTKKYLKGLIENILIEANSLDMEIDNVLKTVRKMRKFYNKVIKNY